MGDWQPIETAPKDGTIVELKSDQNPVIAHNMAWDGVRWYGLWFGVLGTREICWDYSTPPTHWRPIDPPKCDYCLQHHAADDSCQCADCKCDLHPHFIERWRDGVIRLAVCPDCYDVRRAAVGSN